LRSAGLVWGGEGTAVVVGCAAEGADAGAGGASGVGGAGDAGAGAGAGAGASAACAGDSAGTSSVLNPAAGPCTRYTWRVDLPRTEVHWAGWFQGLSPKFLGVKVPKLLVLAGTVVFSPSLAANP
jgi:hypothetical protein